METFIKAFALVGFICLASAETVNDWGFYIMACMACFAVLVVPFKRRKRAGAFAVRRGRRTLRGKCGSGAPCRCSKH